MREAEAFLAAHQEALLELRSRPGVETAVLDLGVEIEVSVYLVSDGKHVE